MKFGWLFIVIAATIWGIDGVLLTPAYFIYDLYNVALIVFMAHFFPLILFSLIYGKSIYKNWKISKKQLFYILLISTFGGTLGTLSIVKSLELSSFNPVSIVILIQKLQPIFAIISAYFILNEKIDKSFKYILIISLICLYFLTFGLKNPFTLKIELFLASFFSLIAAISFGISTTFSRKVATKLDFKIAVFYRYFFTTLISLAILLLFYKSFVTDIKHVINNKIIIYLAIIISILSIISLNFYYIGLKTTKAIYSTICELAFPIVSVLLDIFVNKNELETIKILAAIVLVLTIVYLNTKKQGE